MSGGNISSEKVDLLIYGPSKPIVDNGFSDQFVLHKFETTADLERLTPAVAEKIRGAAVTYNSVRGDGKTLGRFPKLEIVAAFGVGYDHVDANYARDHNIVVTHTPDVLTDDVADIALTLLLSAVRQSPAAERFLRAGKWLEQAFPLSSSLRERSVGIVGLGRIGKAIARRLEGFAVPVSYCGRTRQTDVNLTYYASLPEMAAAVDTLILAAPGGAGTRHLVNADVLEALGPRGIVVNVGRGSVIDEKALVAALSAGRIAAVGLDVYEHEPEVPAELIASDSAVLLPHVGSASHHTRDAMARLVVDNLVSWFAGKGPLTPTPETPFAVSRFPHS